MRRDIATRHERSEVRGERRIKFHEIKLLSEYEKFQIRLTDNIPPFNFQVTGLNTVFLSSRQYMGKQTEKYEDSYIKRIKLIGEKCAPIYNRVRSPME